MNSRCYIVLCLVTLSFYTPATGQKNKADVIKTYNVPLARQGVAIDSLHFYVINNTGITKHLKSNGQILTSWKEEDSIITHLNGGIIINDKLYCVNSNYPDSPMASSIEIFDSETLKHIGNHSFGILNGSLTWIAQKDGYWYATFAHYTNRGSEPGKDNSWTLLAKFDNEWRQVESWIFPKGLIDKFDSRSSSGGVIINDGRIICTSHDFHEVYVLRFPISGFTLIWDNTIPVGSFGQGIAYERIGNDEFIYGIIKKENVVVVSKIN